MEETKYRKNIRTTGLIFVLFAQIFFLSCNTSDDASRTYACGEPVSLEAQIMPIINSECSIPLCHLDGSNPILDSEAAVITHAARIKTQVESFQMPPGGQEPLSPEEIELIACWVEDGAEAN